jgi:hypothetical protein
MKYSRPTRASLPTICLLALSCNRDATENLEKIRTESVKNQNKLADEQIELDQEQAENRAELARDQSLAQSELKTEKAEAENYLDRKIAVALTDVDSERRIFLGAAQKRLQASVLRAIELHAQAQSLGPDKRRAFDLAWHAYEGRRDDAFVQNELAQTATNSQWPQVRPKSEACLDRLEASVRGLVRSL